MSYAAPTNLEGLLREARTEQILLDRNYSFQANWIRGIASSQFLSWGGLLFPGRFQRAVFLQEFQDAWWQAERAEAWKGVQEALDSGKAWVPSHQARGLAALNGLNDSSFESGYEFVSHPFLFHSQSVTVCITKIVYQ